jgi:IclR family acetate operon transcriptional repressor
LQVYIREKNVVNPPGNSQHVRSVQRAARILTTLAEHPYAMGVLELAERVQLSPGSVHRLLSTLVTIGWIEQNSRTAKYRLGTLLVGIGATGMLTNPAIREGMVFLSKLVKSTGCDALLTTLVGMRTVALARVAGLHSLRPELKFEPGLAVPAHASADGKLLLSYLKKEERLYLYKVEGLPSYTARTITKVSDLEAELKKIQAQGYAVDNGEGFEDTRGVAVPILGPDRRPIVALLCLGAFVSAAEARDLVRYLKSVARELADRLKAIGDMPVFDATISGGASRGGPEPVSKSRPIG